MLWIDRTGATPLTKSNLCCVIRRYGRSTVLLEVAQFSKYATQLATEIARRRILDGCNAQRRRQAHQSAQDHTVGMQLLLQRIIQGLYALHELPDVFFISTIVLAMCVFNCRIWARSNTQLSYSQAWSTLISARLWLSCTTARWIYIRNSYQLCSLWLTLCTSEVSPTLPG